ncbi:hypothetical protein TREES_T100005162 [Tupaia chinensis]|uniref:Uncharacterized protein n=1 Tax=Tupaia chinensis TaxID=246437 RepID=L9L244_TUPCH|nr:hypothetical protein TREES_T100005162 [Tupaia chinensis]
MALLQQLSNNYSRKSRQMGGSTWRKSWFGENEGETRSRPQHVSGRHNVGPLDTRPEDKVLEDLFSLWTSKAMAFEQ